LQVSTSPVKRDGQQQFEQEINYLHGTKTRREIFTGRSPEELSRAVSQRLKELNEEEKTKWERNLSH
jgi:hypothetical protein